MLIKLDFLKKNNYLLLFIFSILFIRVIDFGPLAPQGDEAQYWYWSTYFDWGYYSKPPLVAWVIALFSSFFGSSVFILKFPSPLVYKRASLFNEGRHIYTLA